MCIIISHYQQLYLQAQTGINKGLLELFHIINRYYYYVYYFLKNIIVLVYKEDCV